MVRTRKTFLRRWRAPVRHLAQDGNALCLLALLALISACARRCLARPVPGVFCPAPSGGSVTATRRRHHGGILLARGRWRDVRSWLGRPVRLAAGRAMTFTIATMNAGGTRSPRTVPAWMRRPARSGAGARCEARGPRPTSSSSLRAAQGRLMRRWAAGGPGRGDRGRRTGGRAAENGAERLVTLTGAAVNVQAPREIARASAHRRGGPA